MKTSGRLDRRLRSLHHGDSGDQNNSRDDLVRPKRGVKEAPGDADRGERLHHFKVAGGRSFR